MKNTTLPEKASNRRGTTGQTPSGGVLRPWRGALLTYAIAGVGLLFLLSFAGGGFDPREVLASWRGDAPAEVATLWWELRFERLLFAIRCWREGMRPAGLAL